MLAAARLRYPRLPNSIMASAFSVLHGAGGSGAVNGLGTVAAGAQAPADQASSNSNSLFTLTALSRWSVLSKQLPRLSPARPSSIPIRLLTQLTRDVQR